MDKMLVRVAVVFMVTLVLRSTRVVGYPVDHREDTVLPFSLSPGNVNLETYYLNKYPQPGVPGGPLVKNNPTSQMTPSDLDPVPVPEAGGNMFLVPKTYDPNAMFRTRRAAHPGPQPHHIVVGGDHLNPYGGHNHGSMGLGLYNEDTLHLHHHPRYDGGGSGSRRHYHHHNHNNHFTVHSPHDHHHYSQPIHTHATHFHPFPHH